MDAAGLRKGLPKGWPKESLKQEVEPPLLVLQAEVLPARDASPPGRERD
jgi:hypothetical protein